jgi:hypothetical protein
MRKLSTLLWVTFSLGALAACGGDDTEGAGGGGGGGGKDAGPKCSDQVLMDLNLQKDIAKGMITDAADGAGFISSIDATAGGAFTADPDSYTYGKFTDTGLTKVEISDEQSIDSKDWDIAFRRFVIRINSGNSGPSSVKATAAGKIADYDALAAVPAGAMFAPDVYFDAACMLLVEPSGLGSPGTALSSFWEYPMGCVKMTGNVYVLELADKRHIKLSVLGYYSPEVQTQCDTTGMIPMMGSGSGNMRVRWAKLP